MCLKAAFNRLSLDFKKIVRATTYTLKNFTICEIERLRKTYCTNVQPPNVLLIDYFCQHFVIFLSFIFLHPIATFSFSLTSSKFWIFKFSRTVIQENPI